MLIVTLACYGILTSLLMQLPARDLGAWDLYGWAPHGAAAAGRNPVWFLVGLVLFIAMAAIPFAILFPLSRTALAAGVALVFFALSVLASFSCRASIAAIIGREKPAGNESPECDFLLIIAPPPVVIRLLADTQISPYVEKTPYDCAIIAASEAKSDIQQIDDARIYPWDETLQELFVDRYADASSLLDEKVHEAMVARMGMEDAVSEKAALLEDLSRAKRSVSDLSKTLHDIRAKQSSGGIDPNAMSAQQASEEKQRLEERLRIINKRIDSGDISIRGHIPQTAMAPSSSSGASAYPSPT